jgi:hypothetical protein
VCEHSLGSSPPLGNLQLNSAQLELRRAFVARLARALVNRHDAPAQNAYQRKASAQTMIETIEGAHVFTCRLGEMHGEFEPAKSERTTISRVRRETEPLMLTVV